MSLDYEHCPRCNSGSILLQGAVEADIAILGVDEYVYECYDCHTEYVREKGGHRWEYLQRNRQGGSVEP